jgi:hypothetical protein
LVEGARFVLFLSAATLLAVSPGPGMLYVLSRTLHGGRREGFLSAGGTFVGGLVHAAAAGVGLSAILMRSALAFEILRYAGACYLIYLGISMISQPACKADCIEWGIQIPTKLFAGHYDRSSQSEDSAILPLIYSAVCFTGHGTRSSAVPDFRSYFSHPEHRGRSRRCGIRRFTDRETGASSPVHRETAYGLGSGNDRPRNLCRLIQMKQKLADGTHE